MSAGFAVGQAYVAISRAQTLAGLQIRNFSVRVVTASEEIDKFYRHLDAGSLDTFLRSSQVRPWWDPLLDHPAWLAMYRQHPEFRRWERDHPPGRFSRVE